MTDNQTMELCIVNYGMLSPTGINASMSIANVLTGISRKMRFGGIEDMKFVPVTLGVAEYINKDHSNSERMYKLMERAFEESVSAIKGKNPYASPVRLYLGLPKPRPGLATDLKRLMTEEVHLLEIKTGLKLSVEFIFEDHDSGIVALSKAAKEIDTGTFNFVVIGGVDSFVSQKTIRWLENEKRLKCSTNSSGFTPGEAAAFCLLCNNQTAESLELAVKARILSAATKEEPNTPDTGIQTSGQGLSMAIAEALSPLAEDEQIDETFCTLKGLRYEAEEFAFSIPPNGRKLKNPGEFTSLQMNWGDIGAASVPALICYAIEKRDLGFAEAGNNLIFTLSPGKSRSAALIRTT